jgi:hypothetical protein
MKQQQTGALQVAGRTDDSSEGLVVDRDKGRAGASPGVRHGHGRRLAATAANIQPAHLLEVPWPSASLTKPGGQDQQGRDQPIDVTRQMLCAGYST